MTLGKQVEDQQEKSGKLNGGKPNMRKTYAFERNQRIFKNRVDQNGRPFKTSWAFGTAFDL